LAELAGTILAKEIEYTEDSLFEIKRTWHKAQSAIIN
jgi:hypothetical protein